MQCCTDAPMQRMQRMCARLRRARVPPCCERAALREDSRYSQSAALVRPLAAALHRGCLRLRLRLRRRPARWPPPCAPQPAPLRARLSLDAEPKGESQLAPLGRSISGACLAGCSPLSRPELSRKLSSSSSASQTSSSSADAPAPVLISSHH